MFCCLGKQFGQACPTGQPRKNEIVTACLIAYKMKLFIQKWPFVVSNGGRGVAIFVGGGAVLSLICPCFYNVFIMNSQIIYTFESYLMKIKRKTLYWTVHSRVLYKHRGKESVNLLSCYFISCLWLVCLLREYVTCKSVGMVTKIQCDKQIIYFFQFVQKACSKYFWGGGEDVKCHYQNQHHCVCWGRVAIVRFKGILPDFI